MCTNNVSQPDEFSDAPSVEQQLATLAEIIEVVNQRTGYEPHDDLQTIDDLLVRAGFALDFPNFGA